MKESMTSEESKMSKFQKGLWGIISALMLGIILIVVEKLISDWWEAEPTPTAVEKVENQTPPSAEISKRPVPNSHTFNEVFDCKTNRSDDRVTQLKCLENPESAITVSLWLDEPGKKQFKREKKVSIGYEIKGIEFGTPAYFTLINVSPTGQIAMIFSESVEVGKVYGELTAQSHQTIVKHIDLESGQEYFKAIVTSEAINWERFLAMGTKPVLTFWGTGELIVEVN
jgi:hypothetical protein